MSVWRVLFWSPLFLIISFLVVFLRNGSNDFLETLHNVRHRWNEKSDRAGLSKKILDHPKSTKMWSKWHFFDFFSKTALTILTKRAQKVELINSEHLAKTACPKKFPFSRYSSTKFRFWPKKRQSGVQRSH